MKKGFTLIELIAVVILLGIIGLITYPTVTGVINDSKEKAYNTQISMVEEAGERWGVENTNQLNKNKDVLLQIDDLIKSGYITKTKNGELIDPRTNEKLEGCVLVSWSNDYNQYEYKYDTECTEPVDTTPPSIAMNVASGTVNSNGWATSKFYVNVNGDHLTSYKYCVSTTECEPNTTITGNSGSIYIQTAGTNYVCIKGFNTVGSTETICNQYKLDESELTFTVATNDGQSFDYNSCSSNYETAKIKIDITITSANLSGIDHYEYCYKEQNSSGNCTKGTTTNSHIEIPSVKTETKYEVNIKVIDNVGRTAEKTVYVTLYEEYSCFVAGTKVYTEDGYKNIEDIKLGEKVWTLDMNTNEMVLNKVTMPVESITTELYHININNEIISATPRHRFYVQDIGWVRAYDLKVGDVVVSNNQSYIISNINHEVLPEPITTYNLAVENNHNYLVTKYSILVHNCSPNAGGTIVEDGDDAGDILPVE